MGKVYRFGEFALDGATRELSRGAERQILPPKMFECLQWLIDHRDRAVGRDELLAAVWGQVDADANVLVQVIARLRRLIDADGADSAIRTVPRFGYRWAAPTHVGTANGDAPLRISPPRRAVFASVWRTARWSLVLAGLLLIAVAPLRRDTAAPAPLRALVLPASVDAGPATEAATDPMHAEHGWLRLGLMALAIERLRAAGLPVVPADNIVATTRGLDATLAPERYAERVATDWPGSRIVTLDARRQDGRWHVEAVLARDAQAPLRASGGGADVLDAARDAVDGLALALGGVPAPGAVASSGGLLQAQAASLAGEADRAFALLDRVEAPLRQNPEYRYQRAWSEFLAGRLDAAAVDLRALLTDVSAADAPVLRARVLNGLANVQYQQGDTAGQRASADAAVALLEGQDAPTELGRALMGRAVALVRENRIDAARRDFQLARVALESGGDRLGMARAELALGVVHKRQGRFGEARAVFQGALLNLGALRDLHDELLACTHLIETYLQLLEPAEALALESRLAALIARAAPSATRDLAQLTRIEVLAANGRLGEARGLLARACGEAAHCDDHPWRLQLTALRLRLAPDDAAAARDLALALRTPRGSPADAAGRDPGRAWLMLLRERIVAGDAAGTARVLADAQAWADGDSAIETPVYAALARAESAAARGDVAAARGAYERALADADANAVPADLLAVAASYAGWLLTGGDGAEAAVAAGRVAAWARTDFDAALVQLRVQRALGHRPAWQAALAQAQSLAGERSVPPDLSQAPAAVAAR